MQAEAIDRESLERLAARRNFLFGLWAGRTLGFDGETLTRYACDVMAADRLVPGPADVVAKVEQDFDDRAVAFSRAMILVELGRCEDRAAAEFDPAHGWRPT
jgi:hypothetical protein